MSSLPTVLEDSWNAAQPALSSIRQSLSSSPSERPRIIRVGQLDSELLDQELSQLLQEPILKALSLISTSFRARFEPELHLIIQFTLYKLSIWNTGASYGAKLQDLRYVVPNGASKSLAPSGLPRRTLLIHGALTIFVPYLHNRFRTYALSRAWPDAPSSDYRRKIWDILGNIESVHAFLGLLNFIGFLWNGRYRTLADRLLQMSLVPSRRLVKRDVSYEFMNRQMVWHAFTEFLLFLLPLVSARGIRRRLYRLTSLLTTSAMPLRHLFLGSSSSSEKKGSSSFTHHQKRGKFWSLSEDQCAICAENAQFSLNPAQNNNLFTSLTTSPSDAAAGTDSEPPAHPIYNPYQTSCGHIYCYHCIAERIMRTVDDIDEESSWECLRCGEEVKEAHRYTVEVGDSEPSGSDYDFSSDIDIGTDLSGSMGSYSESGFSE